jgi:hypothetical protein
MFDNGPNGGDTAHDAEPGQTDRPAFTPPAWVDDFRRLGVGLKNLFAAQLKLLGAEVNLAKSGIALMLVMGLAAIVFAVGLGFTLLALAGWGLAQWFGSWAWALTALAGLQVVLLLVAIFIFRKGMGWLSLPGIRSEFAAVAKEAFREGKAEGLARVEE